MKNWPVMGLLLCFGLMACAPQSNTTNTSPAAEAATDSTTIELNNAGEAKDGGASDEIKLTDAALDENTMKACKTDADCTVKNVGNCCGYMPACVNVEAKPDPEKVKAECETKGLMSVCGFQEISACSCVNNVCEALGGKEVVQ